MSLKNWEIDPPEPPFRLGDYVCIDLHPHLRGRVVYTFFDGMESQVHVLWDDSAQTTEPATELRKVEE